MSPERYEHFNQLTPAELERLSILSEELGEAQQAIGKILRHGYSSYNPDETDSLSNRQNLEDELGDVTYAIKTLVKAGDLSESAISMRRVIKAEKIRKYLHHQERS